MIWTVGNLKKKKDVEFLYYSAPATLDRQFWADVEVGGWVNMEQQHTWSHSIRPSIPGNSAKKYFDMIEHNLNQAVYYCATALNWILNFADLPIEHIYKIFTKLILK
ncbi:MAG: hypothetical protein ACFFCY_17455 [Promethearchaeota archaeon]